VEKYDKAREANDNNTLWHKRISCWITKATHTHTHTHTHTQHVIFISFPVVTRTRLDVTFIRTLPVLFLTAAHLQRVSVKRASRTYTLCVALSY